MSSVDVIILFFNILGLKMDFITYPARLQWWWWWWWANLVGWFSSVGHSVLRPVSRNIDAPTIIKLDALFHIRYNWVIAVIHLKKVTLGGWEKEIFQISIICWTNEFSILLACPEKNPFLFHQSPHHCQLVRGCNISIIILACSNNAPFGWTLLIPVLGILS